MSYATLKGSDGVALTVTRARVGIPRWGFWSAIVKTARGTTKLTGAVTLAIGALTLAGTVRDGDVFVEEGAYLIFGGADGWTKTIPATSYRGPLTRLSTIVTDAARLVGETVSLEPGVERSIGPHARFKGPASAVLEELVPGRWWVAPDGVTHVGDRAASAAPAARVLDYLPALALAIVSDDDAVFMPEQTIDVAGASRTIGRVAIELDSSRLRTELWLA